MKRGYARGLLVLGIAVAGPMMLGFDLLARRFVMGTQPEEVREVMAALVTPLAWCVVPLPLLGGVLGFLWYPRRWQKSRERWARDASTSQETAEDRADLEALFLTTTLAQLPALLGDLSVILGAHPTPAICSTAVSVTAVVMIGTLARRPSSHALRSGEG